MTIRKRAEILESTDSWNKTAAGLCPFLSDQMGECLSYGIDQKESIKLAFLDWTGVYADLSSHSSSSSCWLCNWLTSLKLDLNHSTINEELYQMMLESLLLSYVRERNLSHSLLLIPTPPTSVEAVTINYILSTTFLISPCLLLPSVVYKHTQIFLILKTVPRSSHHFKIQFFSFLLPAN